MSIAELIKKTVEENVRRATVLACFASAIWQLGMIGIFVWFKGTSEAIELILFWGFWAMAIVIFLITVALILSYSFISLLEESSIKRIEKSKCGEA